MSSANKINLLNPVNRFNCVSRVTLRKVRSTNFIYPSRRKLVNPKNAFTFKDKTPLPLGPFFLGL